MTNTIETQSSTPNYQKVNSETTPNIPVLSVIAVTMCLTLGYIIYKNKKSDKKLKEQFPVTQTQSELSELSELSKESNPYKEIPNANFLKSPKELTEATGLNISFPPIQQKENEINNKDGGYQMLNGNVVYRDKQEQYIPATNYSQFLILNILTEAKKSYLDLKEYLSINYPFLNENTTVIDLGAGTSTCILSLCKIMGVKNYIAVEPYMATHLFKNITQLSKAPAEERHKFLNTNDTDKTLANSIEQYEQTKYQEYKKLLQEANQKINIAILPLTFTELATQIQKNRLTTNGGNIVFFSSGSDAINLAQRQELTNQLIQNMTEERDCLISTDEISFPAFEDINAKKSKFTTHTKISNLVTVYKK
jgi:hypothetical protein